MPRMPQFNDPFMNEDEDEYLPSAPPLPMRAPIADAADISSLIAGASSVQDPTRPRPQSPPLRPAMNELARVNAQRPQYGDPVLKPKALDRVLGGIVGGALGAGTAYVNSGSRGRVMQDQSGEIGANFTNRRYNNAQRDWQDQATKAQTAAEIESKQIATQRDDSFNQARIANQQAQQEAARARAKKLSQPEVPKPISPSARYLNGAQGIYDTQTGTWVDGSRPPVKPEPPADPRKNVVRTAAGLYDLTTKEIIPETVPPPKATRGNTGAPTSSPTPQPTAGALSPTAQGVKDGKVDYHGLGVKDKAAVRNELLKADSGWKEPPKISAGQKDDVANMRTAEQMADDILTLAGPNKNLEGIGPWDGTVGATFGKLTGQSSDRAMQERQAVGNLTGVIRKLQSGAAVTPSEQKQLETYVPSVSDSDALVVSKAQGLKTWITRKRDNLLTVSGPGGAQSLGDGQDPQSLVGKTVKFKDGVSRRILKVLPNGELETDPPR
jgi:hypothetical protein